MAKRRDHRFWRWGIPYWWRRLLTHEAMVRDLNVAVSHQLHSVSGINFSVASSAARTRQSSGINQEVQVIQRHMTAIAAASFLALSGCATETSRSVQVEKVQSASTPYVGVRVPISVGKFDNRSNFMRGVFSDGVDRLGSQAKTTLVSHLQQSQRFSVLDRENMAETSQEAKLQGTAQTLKGASYVVTGDITEFGRKEVGDTQFFGVLGRGKSQVAYAKVTLNIVNSLTSEVVYSARGAGEFELSNREVLGFGGTASYDATLNGKVLDLAMREAVNTLVTGRDAGAWGKEPRQ